MSFTDWLFYFFLIVSLLGWLLTGKVEVATYIVLLGVWVKINLKWRD